MTINPMENITQPKKILLYSILGVLALSIGLYFRLYPLRSFTSDDSSEKAAMFVMAKLKIVASQQVVRNYPNATKQEKDLLAQKLFNELVRTQKDNIQISIEKASENIQQQTKDDQKYPYLIASDSFYFYRLTENLLEKGSLGGPIKGSKYLNEEALAPEGHLEPITLHPYVGLLIYKFMRLFNPNVELMYAVSFTPLLITALALIPFFIICYMLGCRPAASFVGSVFFLLSPIFIKRSVWGWYDNDPYSILFPLIIIALIIYGIRSLRTSKSLLVSCIASIFLMFYAMFWQGWVMLFAVIFVAGIAIIILDIILTKTFNPSENKLKKHILFFISFYVSSFIFISIAFGIDGFFVLFREGWSALKNFLEPQLSAWPDLFLSVAELKKVSLPEIISLTGGYFFFLVSIFGIIYSFIHSIKSANKVKIFGILIIAVFLSATIFITFGAQRFAILCLAPMGLAFVLGIQSIIDIIQSYISRITAKDKSAYIYNSIVIIIVISSVLMPIISLNSSMDSQIVRIYNKTWNKALTEIKEQTPKNSIINAWWPPGHFIKAIARRKVTFDGATINVPQAYWLADVFLSTDEVTALGILRMLNNSANEAADYLQDQGLSLSNTILILQNITKLPAFKAKMILMTVLKDNDKAEHVLSLTHKRPAPSYILLYKEFVNNNIQLSFIGNWDFKKIETINANPKLLEDVPNRTSKEYIDFLWKLAGGPPKYSGEIPQISSVDKHILLFQHNIVINTDNMDCKISSNEYGKGVPYSMFYMEDGKVIEKKFPDGNLPYSVLLIKKSNTYNVILLDRFLAQSLLVQLFYFDGKAMDNIKPIISESDLTKRTEIKVFEVNWEGFEKELKKR